MDITDVKILIFSASPGPVSAIEKKCSEALLPYEVVSSPAHLSTLKSVLEKFAPVTRLMVITDPLRVLLSTRLKEIEKLNYKGKIMFGAAPYFHFSNKR